ncbi:hypothetical protein CLF_100101, partial [Clonorchis sinensis]
MSAHHRHTKRPRVTLELVAGVAFIRQYETETDSSSDISNSCLTIWKAIEENFSNLINPEICDLDEDTYACSHGSTDRRVAGDSVIEYCILLAEDFISWINKFNERREYAFTSRIQKYTTSPTLLSFQQQESKKSALFQLANNVLKNTVRHEPTKVETAYSDSSSQLGYAPKTDIMQSALATTLTSLMTQLQTKWGEIEKQIQPIDPIENQNFLFRVTSGGFYVFVRKVGCWVKFILLFPTYQFVAASYDKMLVFGMPMQTDILQSPPVSNASGVEVHQKLFMADIEYADKIAILESKTVAMPASNSGSRFSMRFTPAKCKVLLQDCVGLNPKLMLADKPIE